MAWVNVTAAALREDVEDLEAWFWDKGAVSVTVEDGLDQPIFEPPPGEQPLWEKVLITGLFEDDIDPGELQASLIKAGYEVSQVANVEDRVWEREWLDRFEPMQFGKKIWVCPSGFEVPVDAACVIRLDPGLAFGTGTHETTRLCLEYLDQVPVEGIGVIDFGCGSGVLGIAAMLLGASRLTAIDNDPQALTATRENAARNDVVLDAHMPGHELQPAALVFANILAQPLVELSDTLLSATLPGGILILSGIMSSQKDWVISAYVDRAELIDAEELNGWVRLVWRQSIGG